MAPEGTSEREGEGRVKERDPALNATPRKCTARLYNRWGDEVTTITVRHKRADRADRTDEYTWKNVPNNTYTNADLSINFETGAFADGDYWWVKFQGKDETWWQSKGNFYCDLTSDDENGVVTVDINAQYYALNIRPPKSSDCETRSIKRV